MNRQRKLLVLRVAAALFAAAGLLMAHALWVGVRALPAHLGEKAAAARELQALRRQAEKQEAALRVYDREFGGARLVPLASVLSAVAPQQGAEWKTLEAPVARPDWQTHRIGVSFTNIPLDTLGLFLQAAETQRPPWKVTECRLDPVLEASALAKAAVTFEAVEKAK